MTQKTLMATNLDLLSNYQGGFSVTPSDSADLTVHTRGLYIGSGGALKVDMASGETLTFVAVPSGSMLPLCVRRVYATGTAASDIVGLT